MGIGATLAFAAAGQESDIAGLVLWDPSFSGHRYIRGTTLIMSHDAVVARDTAPTARLVAHDVAPTLVDDVDHLQISGSSPAQRLLVLTRDGALPPALREWESTPGVEHGRAIGQSELLDVPHGNGVVPEVSIAQIVAWLDSELPSELVPSHLELAGSVAQVTSDGTVVVERVTRLGESQLFGILSEPQGPASPLTVVLLSGGIQHHVGPSGWSVELARRLAGLGVRSLRFDFQGMGDSPYLPGQDREQVYPRNALTDLPVVIGAVCPDGPESVVLVGLSSGGYHAMEGALAVGVRGVCVVHTRLPHATLVDPASGKERLVPLNSWKGVRVLQQLALVKLLRDYLPGPAWSVADRLGLQVDTFKGVRQLVERRINTLWIAEREQLNSKRFWALRRLAKRSPYLSVVASGADHALVEPLSRKTVVDETAQQILRWL
jgi:pimeloyl-ACP methyl ester carboxylesterase